MSTDARFDGPGPDELWRTALAEGRFLVQRCVRCEGHRFPPAVVCAACGAPELAFVEASGRGTVYSTTVVREREGSYNVALIELAEGPRMMSRVEGAEPQAVRIGMAVAARIVATPEPHVVFDAAGGAAP